MIRNVLMLMAISMTQVWGIDPNCQDPKPCLDLIKFLREENPKLDLSEFESEIENAGLDSGPDYGLEVDFDGNRVMEEAILVWEKSRKDSLYCRDDFVYVIKVHRHARKVEHIQKLTGGCSADPSKHTFQHHKLMPIKKGRVEVFKHGEGESIKLNHYLRLDAGGIEVSDSNTMGTWLLYRKGKKWKWVKTHPGSC